MSEVKLKERIDLAQARTSSLLRGAERSLLALIADIKRADTLITEKGLS